MLDKEADFVTILSSDMIAQIVEEYFNKKVYKQPVKVIEAKATEAGYMFSLAFVQKSVNNNTPPLPEGQYKSVSDTLPLNRNSKGQFVKGNE